MSDRDPALIVEAAAVQRIVVACRTDRLLLISSVILEAEVENGPADAQATSRAVLALAHTVVPLAPILLRARTLGRLGMGPADTLHLAAALVGGARYAVSCD